ncbi:hypothetical protein ACIA8G_04780 [Lentzea sp. NPDC051213]|uniref:hypothetical protein n=1 Tax=Lentzea sp. NPDC051213 TaxID=3364126 RepID=UPI0037BC2F40
MINRRVLTCQTATATPLAAVFESENRAEQVGLSPFDRITCRFHRRWIHDCVVSPAHVVAVAGYRWCGDCAAAATVMVDHLGCEVVVWCERCDRRLHDGPNEQLRQVCLRSLEVSRGRRAFSPEYGVRRSA